jgi:pimeloyl-ACP methyl ester carboxylesterase
MMLSRDRGRARGRPWSAARASDQGKARARLRNAERRLRRVVTVFQGAKGSLMSGPTVVLVHGAFGDASNWRRVFDLLQGEECTILAPANPLRGVASDAAYTGAVIDELDAPVVLVGHSYGACVITVAGASEKVGSCTWPGSCPTRASR